LGKFVIPEDKKRRIIVIIILIIIAVSIFLFTIYNIASKKQPDSTINGTSATAKETAGSAKQSGSAVIQSAGIQDVSIFADEYAQQKQLNSASEQTDSQQGQTVSSAEQRLSQTGSILTSAQTTSQQGQTFSATEQRLSQTGSILTSEQTTSQQGQTFSATEQRLSQTGSILTSERLTLQQGQAISTAERLTLQQGQSISATGQQTSQPETRSNSGNTGIASIINSFRTEQTQQNEAGFAISQRELQDTRRTTPVQTPPVQRVISANMVLIISGSFEMDTISDEQASGENAEFRQVTVNSFYIAKYEVTQREYQNIMGYNPSYFKGSNLPVENVSWFDAIEYCNALSRSEGLTLAYTITGSGSDRAVTWNKNANGYRLPTEEEWVYACRANTTTAYNTGDSINRNMANYFSRRTVNVGSYTPNNWGLYDMHGNVSEWCWNLFTSVSSDNVTRIIRGGSWLNTSTRLRSSFRDNYFPQLHTMYIGFRVVQNY